MMDSTFLIKLRAIVMALLLSLFPIHYSFLVTASTHSASPFIDVRFIAGEDGFEGFRRSSDSETIVVHASFGDGTPVTPDSINLRVGEHSRGDFDSCTSVSGSEGIYECTYTATDLFPFVSARTSYHVRLFSGPNQVAASATGHLVVDNVAPRIDTFEIREQRTNKPNVSVSFSVADQAHSGFPGIGVKALRLTSDGTTYFQYPAEGESAPEVTDTDLARRPVSQSNLVVPVRTTSGSSEICLYAEDYMGNEREECKTVTVDVTPPTIRTDTFQVRMADGTEVGWVSDEPVSLRVSIVVEGSNFESLVGDFSSIHSSLSSMQPDCSSLGSDSRNCTFSIDNVHINRTHSFVFNATDDLGNSAVTSLSEPFQHDNTPPVATGLQTSLFADGQSYIARSPVNITVTFRETGVGMADEEAYLDLSDLGLDVQQADNCTQGSTTWSCYWTDISPDINRIRGLQKLQIPIVDVYEYEGINGMEYEEEITYIDLEAYRAQLRITPDTCDDLVNCAEQRVFNVTVDIDPPRVEKEDIQLVNVPGSNNDFPDIRVVGDGIFITANVTDATPVRINVSTTHFYNNTPRFSMVRECTDLGDGTHQCSVNLPPITREGYYVGSLTVSFIDTLGNTRTHTLDNLEVLSIADEQVMIWNGYSRLCTPHALDRELAGKSGFRNSVYCAMGLRTDYDAEIYHMRRGVCTDVTPETPLTGRQNTIVDLSWLGLGARQPLVYANLLLSNFDPRIDKLVYECQVHVRSVVTTNNNRYITRMYQPVNVTFELELYNSPLGELDQVLYDEAKSIYDSYIGSGWDTVTRLRNFFDLSSQICRIGMSIQRILNAGRSLGLLFGGLSEALGSNPLTASAGISSQLNSAAANQATDGAAEGFKRFWQKWMGKYCAFISCKLHFGDAWTAAGNFQQTCSAAFSLMSDPARYLLPTDVGAILSADQRASETPRPDGTGTDSSADAETVEPTFWTRAQQSVVHPWRGEAGADTESMEGGFGNWWTGETTLLSVPGDPRDNYILAVCTLCIPGIIYNLEKYRQMKCELGNCLISTANGGIPIEVCRAQYAYAECKYIFGPIFELMPFTQFLSQVGRFVANLLANPSLAIDVTMGFFCQTQIGAQIICRTGPTCTEPNLGVYACLIYDTFGVFMDIYNDITGYVDGGFFSNVNLNSDSGSCAAFAENFERLSARDD